MKRPSISLAMIVKNEAENLPRLIESVKGCVDEIHITDTGSTDDTVAVAESLGAKVHHFTWCDDFSAARNFSFSQTKTDYVLWLDGDDVLENPEAFKHFRDHVMYLADYWIAPYHYASDAQGNAVCTFARERVIRMGKGLEWKYPIHEGVMPTGSVPIKSQYIGSFAVRHMRTDADLLKDRSRNLGIFERLRDKASLDARMKYYYGKELFEAQKPVEAIVALGEALSDPKLELHDRILAYQYICYAHMQCENYPKVIEFAHLALMLAPNRAEYHTILGDAFLKLGRMVDAVPSFAAAKACSSAIPPNMGSPIFVDQNAYSVYPMNQLSRIYANLGDFDRAEAEAQECATKFKNTEAQAILTDIRKFKLANASFKNAKPCDDITIVCPPQGAYEWDPGIAGDKSMGGSETAAIEMAHHLHKLSGRPVKVFNMRSTRKSFSGVEYIPANEVNDYMSKHKPFLNINWRHAFKVTDAPTFVWSHDLQTPGVENISAYDKVMCLTPFHKNYMMATQGVPEHKIYVTRNGLIPERFVGGPWKKDPNKFVFSSSPDRGLDRAMRVLDRVRLKHPDVKLHIFYGIEHLEKYGLGALQAELKKMIEDRKDWVIYHGATQQEKLMEEFKTAAYSVQPADWIETSMISAMERACMGIYQIMRAVGGAVDTLKYACDNGMAVMLQSDCITEREHDLYAEEVCRAMDEERYKRVSVDAAPLSWENVAKEWLRDLPTLTKGANGSAA